jgi:anthranilate synthase component II
MRILIVDNYDSFTYNLVHLVEKITGEIPDVKRNDEMVFPCPGAAYDKIILSPGPGIPSEAGSLMEAVREFAGKKPVLGVCLGHQAIAEYFGSPIYNLETVFHGVATEIHLENNPGYLFREIPPVFRAGRYHSWAIDEKEIAKELRVTARDADGRVMAFEHRQMDIAGVQFHPESIMTEYGETIMRNFLIRNDA